MKMKSKNNSMVKPNPKQNGSPLKVVGKHKPNKGTGTPKKAGTAAAQATFPQKGKNKQPFSKKIVPKKIEDEEADSDDSEIDQDSGADIHPASDNSNEESENEFIEREAVEDDVDEEDDDDDDDDEDVEDDDEEDEAEVVSKKIKKIAAKASKKTAVKDDEDEDDDDDEEEDEDEDQEAEDDDEDQDQDMGDDGEEEAASDDDGPTEAPISKKDKLAVSKKAVKALHNIQTGSMPKDIPEERMIFIKNLPKTVELLDIAEVFMKYGPITHYTPLTFNSPNASGALLAFETAKAAKAALAADATEVGGRTISVAPKKAKKELHQAQSADVQTRTIYVSNFKQETTEDELRTHFSKCGSIEHVKLMHRKSKNFAFITFKDKESLVDAKKLHNSDLNGNIITVSLREDGTKEDPKLTVVLKNPDQVESFSEEKLREIFAKCGEIQNIRVLCRKTVLAFIQFTTEKGVEKALKMNGSTIGGIKIEIGEYQSQQSKTRVFVQHLKPGTSEEALRELMGRAGEITNITIKFNYAIVTYKDSDAFCKAFLLNESVLDGNMIFLEPFSEKKSMYMKRPGPHQHNASQSHPKPGKRPMPGTRPQFDHKAKKPKFEKNKKNA